MINRATDKPTMSLGQLIGFVGVVEEEVTDNSLDSGLNTLSGTVVPSGRVHIITQVAFFYTGTPPTRVTVQGTGLAGGLTLLNQEAPVTARPFHGQALAFLQAGDKIEASVAGATAGDKLTLRYAGFSMAVPE